MALPVLCLFASRSNCDGSVCPIEASVPTTPSPSPELATQAEANPCQNLPSSRPVSVLTALTDPELRRKQCHQMD